jgi:hypothetical protein
VVDVGGTAVVVAVGARGCERLKVPAEFHREMYEVPFDNGAVQIDVPKKLTAPLGIWMLGVGVVDPTVTMADGVP